MRYETRVEAALWVWFGRGFRTAFGEITLAHYRDLMTRALAAADAAGWQATHQHHKGGLYRVIVRAEMEADLSPCVVYDDAEGRTWVRPAWEFDGRFSALPAPPEAG